MLDQPALALDPLSHITILLVYTLRFDLQHTSLAKDTYDIVQFILCIIMYCTMNEQLLHVRMYVYKLLLNFSNSIILCPENDVYYVRSFVSFDWSACMSPGGTGSRKSQMSMVSSLEPLTIWKSSICRQLTESKCSYD